MTLDHYGDPEGGATKEQWWCGQPLDGRAVGRPGEQVACRATDFDLWIRGAQVMHGCPTCGAHSALALRRTAQRRQGPHGQLQCAHCGHGRFRLYDDGNEIETRCAQCGAPEPLGVAAHRR